MTITLTTIAKILRNIGTPKCITKAESLENESAGTTTLHFRNLGLTASDIIPIAEVLKQEGAMDDFYISSLSFSYNGNIADAGATTLMKNLPVTIPEIGLVGCGIGDAGGLEILAWMKRAIGLRMICMEGNNFSENTRSEFAKFKSEHRNVVVVY